MICPLLICVWILVSPLHCDASDYQAKRTLCNYYRVMHKYDFLSTMNDRRIWNVQRPSNTLESRCMSKLMTKENCGVNRDRTVTCMKYRFERFFYDLTSYGYFGRSKETKIRKYFLWLGLKLTADYNTVCDLCNTYKSQRFYLITADIYDEIARMIGLIKKSGSYLTPSNQQCRSYLQNNELDALAIREWSGSHLKIFDLCQCSLYRKYYCQYYTLSNFAIMLGNNRDAFRATNYPCDAMKFAFVHSSFYYRDGKYAGDIVLKEDEFKKGIRSGLRTLAEALDKSGCQSKDFQTYGKALQAYKPSDWYQKRQVYSSDSKASAPFKMYCDVMDSVVLVGEYLATIRNSIRVVDASIDYEQYLQTKEITGTIEEKFDKLGQYFISIQNFNKQKSKNDLDYINGRIAKFNKTLKETSEKAGAGLGLVVSTAFLQSAGNLISKGAKFGLAIAEACNPLKSIFGGTSASDIANAASDLAEANAKMMESRQLVQSIKTLESTLAKITRGLNANQRVLNKAYNIVTRKTGLSGQELDRMKADFLQEYGDYNPAVDKNNISLVSTQYETVVDNACELIRETHDVHDVVMKFGVGVITDYFKTVPPNPCLTTKWEVSQTMTILEEIFDFQNELMETCASYLRAKIAEEKALDITSASGQSSRSGQLSKQDSIDIASIYRDMEHCNNVEEFCDILEYRDGGRRPDECINDKPDVARLLGAKPRFKVEEYLQVDVPDVKAGQSVVNSIDIDRLIAGEPVSFQIPDFDWLLKHANVHESERQHDIFVKNIVIFVPFVTQGITAPVISQAKAVGGFTLKGGTLKYMLGIPFTSRFKYSEGTDFLSCHYHLKDNLYTLCDTNPLNSICPLMRVSNPECDDEDVRMLFPSIYTKWTLQLLGYHKTLLKQKLPVAKTSRSVKLAFVVCKFQSEARLGDRRSRLYSRSHNRCCRYTDYWDEEKGECRRCPQGSYQMLNGYYCAEYSRNRNKGDKSEADIVAQNSTDIGN